MAISSSALKGLVGLGAVSTVAIGGGVYLYNEQNSSKSETIENLVLSTEKTWTWGIKTETSDDSSKYIKVKGTLIDQKNSENKIWSCKIKGKIEKASKNLNIDSQLTELKTALGINGDANQTRSKNKNHNFKQFFEKCKKGTLLSSNADSTERAIEIETETSGENNYKFKIADFKDIYDGRKEIIKELGIETKTLNKEHELKKEQLEKIKFEGKTNLKITNVADLKLKIEETSETDIFPEGLKFTFITSRDIDQISIKANTNTEFKVKVTGEGVYSLEKAWTKETLAAKVDLKKQTENEFIFKNDTKVNVYRTTDNIFCFGSTTVDKSISFTIEEAAGHNQGFKVIVKNDINLTGCTPQFVNQSIKLDSKKSYSIEYKNESNLKGWYFIEKTN